MVSSPLPVPKAVLPAQALVLDVAGFGLTRRASRSRAVGLAEGVATGDEGHGLFVVHGHAAERLADVVGRQLRVGVAVGTLGVDVDEAHLDRRERTLELAVARVALVAEPRGLGAPVHVVVGLPHVGAAPGEAEVGNPMSSSATLPARIIRSAHEIDWPYFFLTGQSRRRALSRLTLSGQLFSGAKRCIPAPEPPRPSSRGRCGAVPRHADHEGAVVTEVGGPPVLRGRHDLLRSRFTASRSSASKAAR